MGLGWGSLTVYPHLAPGPGGAQPCRHPLLQGQVGSTSWSQNWAPGGRMALGAGHPLGTPQSRYGATGGTGMGLGVINGAGVDGWGRVGGRGWWQCGAVGGGCGAGGQQAGGSSGAVRAEWGGGNTQDVGGGGRGAQRWGPPGALPQGAEPGATILPQPLHKAKPGTCPPRHAPNPPSAPHRLPPASPSAPLPGFTQLLTPGASPPPEDKALSPHAV